jgi:hypothetical protein
MGFDLSIAAVTPSYLERQLIPHSELIGDSLYFYGITKRMWGTTNTNRYAFIVMLDVPNEQFGSHIGISQMSIATDGGSWWTNASGMTEWYYGGFWASGVASIVDNMGTRVITDLDTADFAIYDVKEEYLEYGTSNSFVSTIELGVESN